MPNNEDHGFNSPSQIWANSRCPGRPNKLRKLELPAPSDDGENKGSIPARRGTWQHDATKVCFEKGSWLPDPLTASSLEIESNHLEDVQWCADQVFEILHNALQDDPNSIILWEHQMDLSALGIDGGKHGCRADVIIIVPGQYVIVIDFKFGFMWCPGPAKNPQFYGYVWGAREEFGGEVVWAIKLQPQLRENQQFTEHTFDLNELDAIEEEILSINTACEDPEAPLCRGDHCVFCPAVTACEQWRDTYLELPRHVTIFEHMNRLSVEEAGSLYDNLLAARSWTEKAIEQVQGWAFADRKKNKLSGFEIGPGKSSRDWIDPIKAKAVIRELCKEDKKNVKLCLTSPQPAIPLAPYQVEKVLGKSKKSKSRLSKHIILTEGKEVLKKAKESC